MSVDIEKMASRLAALEARFAAEESKDDKKDDADNKEASERMSIASEIAALERKLAAEDDEEEFEAKKAADEKDDEKVDEKKASLADPNGVEEQITQKRFTEVEDLEHGTELATDDTTLDAAPTEYVARMKNASSRLDAVATYLEKTGRTAMALRLDKIADSIDARVAKITRA
jgi:hypothetical protein